MTLRVLRLTVSAVTTALIAAPLVIASAAPASAHAIVALNGDPAYAGRTSTMTLEIQHGCLQNEAGIDKIAAYFDKAYVKVDEEGTEAAAARRSNASVKRAAISPSLTATSPAKRGAPVPSTIVPLRMIRS